MSQKKIKIIQIIYFALIFSSFVYLYIGTNKLVQVSAAGSSYETGTPDLPPSLEHPLLYPFLGISIFILLLAFFVPQKMIKKISNDLQKQKLTFDADINKLVVPLVIRAALIEAVVLFGLVLSLSSSDPNAIWIFWSIAFASFIFAFPTQSRVENWLTGEKNLHSKASSMRL